MNRDCVAAILYNDRNSVGTTQAGVSVNADGTDRTTNIVSISDLSVKLVSQEFSSGFRGSTSVPSYLFKKGDIIRAHGSGDANETAANGSFFRIQEVYRLG